MDKHGLISADSHLDISSLPSDFFVSRAPAEWKERVPRVIETPQGPQWVAGEHGQYKLVRLAGPGRHRQHLVGGPRDVAMREAGFKRDQRRPGVPDLRIQDQEVDGVEAEVIYGVAHNLGQRLPDLDLLAVSLSVYNDFIAEFNQTYPGRFYGLGGVAGNSPEAAVREIEHVASLGLPGAQLTMYGLAKPLWHPAWEPVWAALSKHHLPVHAHIGKGTTTVSRGEPGDVVLPDLDHPANAAAFICVCSIQADEALASIVLCGALERHPNLKWIMAECEAGWVPFLLARMDDQWEENYFKWKEMITIKPSDLFRRQYYVTFERDSVGPRLAAEFCPDNFMWGSDYPHESNGTWPNSRAAIQKYIGGVDEAMRQKLVHDNAAALYHIP